MKKILAICLVFISVLWLVTSGATQTFTLKIWIDKGCGAEYHVGEAIEVHWEVSHSCQITFYEIEPDETIRELPAGKINVKAGHDSKRWIIRDYGYGKRKIQVHATSSFGSDVKECNFYVVEEKKEPPDRDKDGVPDSIDYCYNPNCRVIDSEGCPKDSDEDGLNDCEDDCPFEYGEKMKDGCPPKSTNPPPTIPPPAFTERIANFIEENPITIILVFFSALIYLFAKFSNVIRTIYGRWKTKTLKNMKKLKNKE